MTERCPEREEWLGLLDGEATENRAAELRAHAEACPRCAQRLALEQQLLADLAAPASVSADGVAAVMRRLDRAPAPARAWRWRTWGIGAAGLAAAATVVALVWPAVSTDRGTFVPRGQRVPWVKKVGVEVFALEPTPHKLEAGGTLSPSTPMVASYHNVDTAAAYLMVFALDGRGELYWAYPGFEDARTDPPAVRLEPQQLHKLLPDSVMLDQLPAGPIELVTLIAREPLRVSHIESRPAAERAPARLRARFPEARVDVLPLRVLPPPAGKP